MPNDTQRIEIITGRERRRRYTAHENVRFVEETMQPGMTVSAVARIHGIKRHPELTSSRHEDLTPMLISHA